MVTFLRRLGLAGSLAVLCPASPLLAEAAGRFDLAGPQIEVRVTRGTTTLPIASVPNLQVGDRLWVHPDLPETQSKHLLLVVAFLRGTTNPPPDKWFFKLETWNKRTSAEGMTVTVPDGAEQAILFLAPETGGDFSTLRSAVEGRPGIFVRASQDLAEAGFEQARIEKYLEEMKQVPPGDPKALLDHSNLLARTLNLKPNEECFKKPVDQQYNCLTQTGTQTLLDDGHGQTVVAALTSGPGSDLISAASATQLMGGGLYSAYVGAVVDVVRLMSGLHTAQYQYIPAIAFPDQQKLNLRLNVAPSFHNPKSVIVIGLPAIQASVPPPLRPADPKRVTCLLAPRVTLGVEGAPLVFSTALAHDLVLHLNEPHAPADLPLVADAFRGGLVLEGPEAGRKVLPTAADQDAAAAGTKSAGQGTATAQIPVKPAGAPPASAAASTAPADAALTGTVRGYWGFDAFTGPTLKLQNEPGRGWKLDGTNEVIAGEKAELRLTASAVGCLDSVTFTDAAGKPVKAEWKPTDAANEVLVTLPTYAGRPGELKLMVHQFGDPAPPEVAVRSFARPADLSGVEYHAGDPTALLRGSGLEQVREMRVGKAVFRPVGGTATTSSDGLRVTLAGGDVGGMRAGDTESGEVALEDGRTLRAGFTVLPGRPALRLLSVHYTLPQPSPIQLSNKDDLPVSAHVAFSLRTEKPMPRDGVVELASEDGALSTKLSVASGSLVLEDKHTVLAELDPEKMFGRSAFGPVRMRLMLQDGTTSDWIPLGTLVRLPGLQQLQCAPGTAAGVAATAAAAAGGSTATSPTDCTLSGTSLYLIREVAADAGFAHPTEVPDGFVGTSLEIPRPVAGQFFLKLRDDPEQTDAVVMGKTAAP